MTISRTHRFRRRLIVAVAAGLALCLPATSSHAESLAPISGSGSTYVGVAMRKWVADGQTLGMSIGYTPSGSPTGLNLYSQNTVDFAGTEAEFTSIGVGAPPRGFQYVPDVAGAVAIMYNISESSGRKVDYLHLDRKTVARIFTGEITTWDDPAIVATNKGIHFPSQPIRVVLRNNPSGTTALFYDFNATTLGAEYTNRFRQFGCAGVAQRPVQITCTNPAYIPHNIVLNDSDQIAQYLSSPAGKWSIGFDEFAYAKVYGASTAWIQNGGGKYVLPYAQNISTALVGAKLRPDLSQDLSAVYASTNPQAYPISAYSYMTTQCAVTGSRPTCQGPYSDAGKSGTLAKWMRYIACDGQVSMAALGYSPLPPNLSQEMMNSVGRLTGAAPTALTASNCSNPRFQGSLGAGSTSPCDPFVCGKGSAPSTGGSTGSSAPGAAGTGSTAPVTSGKGRTTPSTTSAATGKQTTTSGGATPGGAVPPGAVTAQKGADGGAVVALGGSDAASWRRAEPVQFTAAVPTDPFGALPAAIVLVALLAPIFVVRRRRASAGAPPVTPKG
ncbi:substrate-binding domain-containing protein [Dermatophilaceae bacterium Soc4.6]